MISRRLITLASIILIAHLTPITNAQDSIYPRQVFWDTMITRMERTITLREMMTLGDLLQTVPIHTMI